MLRQSLAWVYHSISDLFKPHAGHAHANHAAGRKHLFNVMQALFGSARRFNPCSICAGVTQNYTPIGGTGDNGVIV
jgi:hypothetical protein